jgi:transposase
MDNRIRQCIFKFVSEDDEFLSGEVEMDESYFGGKRKVKRGRGAKVKIPVFGILEREGKVKVEIVKDVTAETLLMETIKKVKRGSIIYTDKFKAYDGLVMYGFKHERIDKSIKFSNGKVYINGIEGFWSYAKERLLKFHGVSREYFVYYLKELEFRYNFRANLDEMLYNVLGGIK